MKVAFEKTTAVEATVVVLLALGLYLPFLAIQYDTNGVVEAAALESGSLINKNHMLYRPIGMVVYSAVQHLGYGGRSLFVLQVLNAICGAIGVGFAYLLFKSAARDRATAATGSFLLATSFTYWMFSTDVAYVTLAALLVLAALVCITCSNSSKSIVAAGILVSLSILTWQAGIFLVPAMLLFVGVRGNRPLLRHAALLTITIGLVTGLAYAITAFALGGVMGPAALFTWLTNYSEGGTLPLWGVWDSGRIESAAISAVRSVVPVLLAVWPSEVSRSVQLGRIAVDIALIGAAVLMLLAAWKARVNSWRFILGYAFFIPFIVWWDPFEPKWFLVPNIFLAGFLSCGLQPWLHHKRAAPVVILCGLAIAGANFMTTVRPRHNQPGLARSTAQCVADHMKVQDAFLAAEWGWPDYLEYLHSRTSFSLIGAVGGRDPKERSLAVKTFITSTQQTGGDVYIADPHFYSESHLAWLNAQKGLTFDELVAWGGSPSFMCSERAILKVPSGIGPN